MITLKIKILPLEFRDISARRQTYILAHFPSDVIPKPYDSLRLEEYDKDHNRYSGCYILCTVQHVTRFHSLLYQGTMVVGIQVQKVGRLGEGEEDRRTVDPTR